MSNRRRRRRRSAGESRRRRREEVRRAATSMPITRSVQELTSDTTVNTAARADHRDAYCTRPLAKTKPCVQQIQVSTSNERDKAISIAKPQLKGMSWCIGAVCEVRSRDELRASGARAAG